MTALMLPILLGFTGLAIDAGFAFEYRKRAQMAADAGALAGAHAVLYNPSIGQSELETIVRNDTSANGFSHSVGGVTVTVYLSPTTAQGFQYNYSTDPSAVGVVVSQPRGMVFMPLVSSVFNSLTIGARAVANQGAKADDSIVVLAQDASEALLAAGNGTIDVAGSVTVNSTDPDDAAETQGTSGHIIAGGGVFVVGGADNSGGDIKDPLVTGAPPRTDPLGYLVAPTQPVTPGGCPAPPDPCTAGYYPAGLKPNGQNLSEGLYWVDGGVEFDGEVNGTEVMIYINSPGPSYSWELKLSTTKVHLSAPTATTGPMAPYKGILIFQSRTAGADADVKAGAQFSFEGYVYMHYTGCKHTGSPLPDTPCSGLILWAGAGQTDVVPLYTVFIVDTMHLQGGGLIQEDDFTTIGGPLIKKVSLVE